MNHSKKGHKSKQKHTANYLASSFFGSNLSLRYKLKTIHWAIIRYLCDCIDKNYKKTKKFEVTIYQSQIAKFIFSARETVNREIKVLVKKRILKPIKDKKNVYTLGKLLPACDIRSHPIEVCRNITPHRSVTLDHTSNSSNLTKYKPDVLKPKNHKLNGKSTTFEGYAPNGKSMSPLAESILNNQKGKR